MNTSELFKRQKIAEEVADKLLKKAKQRAKESDQKSSHLPNETRAIVRVYNGLLLWCCEGYPNEILWFYQYGSMPCWQRTLMFDRDMNTAIVLLKDKGKAALAADVEGRWQNIIQTARKTDETLSGLSERYNHDEDNPAYANDVKSALFDIKTYASQLGDSLFEVAKQQASEAKTQLEQKLPASDKAGDTEPNKPQKSTGASAGQLINYINAVLDDIQQLKACRSRNPHVSKKIRIELDVASQETKKCVEKICAGCPGIKDAPAESDDPEKYLRNVHTWCAGQLFWENGEQIGAEKTADKPADESAETGQDTTPAKCWGIWTLVKRIPRWIYVLVIFLGALLTCIYLLWWLWTKFWPK